MTTAPVCEREEGHKPPWINKGSPKVKKAEVVQLPGEHLRRTLAFVGLFFSY